MDRGAPLNTVAHQNHVLSAKRLGEKKGGAEFTVTRSDFYSLVNATSEGGTTH